MEIVRLVQQTQQSQLDDLTNVYMESVNAGVPDVLLTLLEVMIRDQRAFYNRRLMVAAMQPLQHIAACPEKLKQERGAHRSSLLNILNEISRLQHPAKPDTPVSPVVRDALRKIKAVVHEILEGRAPVTRV
jgi:hypothetical protein